LTWINLQSVLAQFYEFAMRLQRDNVNE